MNTLEIEALEQKVGRFSNEEAIRAIEETLRMLRERTPEFFVDQFQLARRILALLAQYDIARADALFDVCYQGMERRLHLSNLRYWVHRDARRVVRRRELEALNQDELDAYLVLIALTPQGMPDLDEQIILVELMLARDSRRACTIAAHWWTGAADGDREKVVGRLVEACWESYPNEVRILLSVWGSSQGIAWAVTWTECLLPSCSQEHIDFLAEKLQSSSRSEWLEWFAENLSRWNLDRAQQRSLLDALKPGWALHLPHTLKYDHKKSWGNLIALLWPLDSGPEWESYLASLLAACEPADRLGLARRTRHRLQGVFGRQVYLEALASYCTQTARELLTARKIQKSHQSTWRRLARAMRLAELFAEETLYTSFRHEGEGILKKVRKARGGTLLLALENQEGV